MNNEVSTLIAAVRTARQQLIEELRSVTEERATWVPDRDEWSIAQIVEHLVLAEHSGLVRMWRALISVRQGNPIWQGSAPHHGRSIEEIVALTWKEKEDAPANTIPQTNGPLAYWIACLEACQPVLDMLGKELKEVDLASIVAPHIISGPLDARQRLTFLRWHLYHHREQIRSIQEMAVPLLS